MSTAPSFARLYHQSRYARTTPERPEHSRLARRELFAVAGVAFLIKHDAAFRQTFLRQVCGVAETDLDECLDRRSNRFLTLICVFSARPDMRSTWWSSRWAPTFSDALAQVRRCLWRQMSLMLSYKNTDRQKIPAQLFAYLGELLAHAA